MKNLIFLLLFTLFVSCEKTDEPDVVKPPTEISTSNDLAGTWEFVNFNYPGKGDFKDCPITDPILSQIQRGVLLSFTVTGTKCTVTDKCKGVVAQNYNIVLTPPNLLVIQDPIVPQVKPFTFHIKSYSQGVLVLLLDIATNTTGMYVTTELTVKKK